MQFFVDTGLIDEIKRIKEMGLLDGVTTNPTLAAQAGAAGKDFRQLVADICEIVQGPVSAEVLSTKADEMVAEARELSDISEHVVVKLPTIPEGIKGPMFRSGHQDQLDAGISAAAGLDRRQARRDVRQSVPRPTRRHRSRFHGHPRHHPRDLRQLRL